MATDIHNAWLATLEDGIHTYDIFKSNVSKEQVGTKEFAQAVIKRLGKRPHTLPAVHYQEAKHVEHPKKRKKEELKKELMGSDVFIQWEGSAEKLAQLLNKNAGHSLQLTMISNRGVRVWPEQLPETSCVDSWRCRFTAKKKGRQ